MRPGPSPGGSWRLPLPPYMERSPNRIATTTNRLIEGPLRAQAAPTAGLFSEQLWDPSFQRTAALQVGLGTFQPIRSDDVRDHQMHQEHYFCLGLRRIRFTEPSRLAVGTTSCERLMLIKPLPSSMGETQHITPQVGLRFRCRPYTYQLSLAAVFTFTVGFCFCWGWEPLKAFTTLRLSKNFASTLMGMRC